jgi:hypothetical protein
MEERNTCQIYLSIGYGICVTYIHVHTCMHAYRYFDCKWVKEICNHEIRQNSGKCILKANLLPRSRLTTRTMKKDSNSGPGGEFGSAYCLCTVSVCFFASSIL